MHISYVVILKMKKIRITAIRKVQHSDLSTMYENPIEHTCDIEEGFTQLFSENIAKSAPPPDKVGRQKRKKEAE